MMARVVISPATNAMPVVTSVSQATRLTGSCVRMASRIESEIWSAILSGCPSVTDSDVKRCRPLRLMRAPFECWKRLSLSDLGAGVEPVVDGAQARLEHVRVDLRRRQIGV